jgi:hypothetical protein
MKKQCRSLPVNSQHQTSSINTVSYRGEKNKTIQRTSASFNKNIINEGGAAALRRRSRLRGGAAALRKKENLAPAAFV